jgi:hypothetical protein
MSRSARVTNIETVDKFRSSLCEFGEDVMDTLCAVDMHIRRTFDWLAERAKFWQHEIRKRQEDVVRAKIELQSRKNMCKDGRGPGTTDQEKALRKAQARLKEAEDKLINCKRWLPLLQHATKEYYGPARSLANVLDTTLVQALARLEQKFAALQAYLALAPPSTSDVATVGSSAESLATSEAPGGTATETVPEQPAAAPEEVAAVKESKPEAEVTPNP